MSEKTYMLRIEKGDFNLEIDRKEIAEIKQTHDGIVFNFKAGMHLYVTDTYMPRETKQKIITAFDRFGNVNIVVNLLNQHTPATINAS